MANRTGVIHNMTLARYKEAWKQVFPNRDVPLTSDGNPVDFSCDPNYPCPEIPWLKDFTDMQNHSGDSLICIFVQKVINFSG